jgi:hypothetical protein
VALTAKDRERHTDILDSGPVAYGSETGIWTAPLVSQITREESGRDLSSGARPQTTQTIGLLQATTDHPTDAGGTGAETQVGALYVSESKKTPKP